jgi:hypothetical protein
MTTESPPRPESQQCPIIPLVRAPSILGPPCPVAAQDPIDPGFDFGRPAHGRPVDHEPDLCEPVAWGYRLGPVKTCRDYCLTGCVGFTATTAAFATDATAFAIPTFSITFAL